MGKSHSLVQSECECGPRTIGSIWRICRGREDKVSIPDCITRATWSNVAEGSYNATHVRNSVAELINDHLPVMASKNVRFRKRGDRIVAGKTDDGRKRKHKRGSRNREIEKKC